MKQHRRSLSLVGVLLIATIASVMVWHRQGNAQDRLQVMRRHIDTLDEVIGKANEHFYKGVDTNKMLEGAIRGTVAALNDPYSFYQSPPEYQRERETLFQAKFGGLGIRIYPEPHGDRAVVKISTPLRNSPAVKHGLQAGDIILKVNSESVILGGPSGLSLDDVVSRLRGPVGEPVTITVERRGRPDPFDVTLTREEIKLESVEWTSIEPGIAYIAVESFTGSTGDELVAMLKEIQKQIKVRGIVLDLRGNRGGMLQTASGTADAFLDGGVIVSTRGREEEFNHIYKADKDIAVPLDVQLVVLVDGDSASGSEIVAGAVKDLRRGVLVGTKTFGKGVVQQRFELRNGGAVSLTISTYYTPNGTSIDGEGITPNIVVEREKLTDEERFYLEKIREKRIVDDYMLGFIRDFERERSTTPRDFTLFEPKLPELQQRIEQANYHLSPRYIRLEARNVFDLNVGNQRLVDIENDRQLTEAVHIVRDVGVAKVLDGTYHVAAQKTTTN